MMKKVLSMFLCMNFLPLVLVAAENNTFKPIEKFEDLPMYQQNLATNLFNKEKQVYKECGESSNKIKEHKTVFKLAWLNLYNYLNADSSRDPSAEAIDIYVKTSRALKNTTETPSILDKLLPCMEEYSKGTFDLKNLSGELPKKLYALQALSSRVNSKTRNECSGSFCNNKLDSCGNDLQNTIMTTARRIAKAEWNTNFGRWSDLRPESGDPNEYDKYCFKTPLHTYQSYYFGSGGDAKYMSNLRIKENLKKQVLAIVKKNANTKECDDEIVSSGAKKLQKNAEKLQDLTINFKSDKYDWMLEKSSKQ